MDFATLSPYALPAGDEVHEAAGGPETWQGEELPTIDLRRDDQEAAHGKWTLVAHGAAGAAKKARLDLERAVFRARRLIEAEAPEGVLFSTGCLPIDGLLGGGLLRGEMVEIVGWRSSGRFALVLSLLASTTQCGEAAALIDLGDHFDPQLAAQAGVDLERLLWVRPAHIKPAVAAAEMLLAAEFPVVVLDLGVPPVPGGRGVEAAWQRLQRAALAHQAALLISAPYRTSGTAAQAVIELRQILGGNLGDHEAAGSRERSTPRARASAWLGSGLEPRLLSHVMALGELQKSRLPRLRASQLRGQTRASAEYGKLPQVALCWQQAQEAVALVRGGAQSFHPTKSALLPSVLFSTPGPAAGGGQNNIDLKSARFNTTGPAAGGGQNNIDLEGVLFSTPSRSRRVG